MKPLAFHVQSVPKMITRSLSRLLDSEVQAWEDAETTIEEFIERTDECLAMLKDLSPVTFVDKKKSVISLPMGDSTGKKFILGFGVPDDYFHLTLSTEHDACHLAHEGGAVWEGG